MPTPADGPLQRLSAMGQSVWLDFLSREIIRGGHLQQLIDDYAVVGATSNPSIFEKAMSAGDAYDEQIHQLAEDGCDATQTFWALAEEDIREACDVFRPVWDRGAGRDGYVSLEVDPRLAYDTLETFREAIRLHEAVDRPNLLVKIPATKPGLGAIEDVIAKGRSVNITLIFSLRRYAEVAECYLRGLERLVSEGGDPAKVASVASFFVSRIDAKADREIDERLAGEADAVVRERLEGLRGTLALANARLAYGRFMESLASERWHRLAERGARPQRLLWASTSTKDPRYDDLLYVDNLIGRRTVDTMPQETLDAFLDHGVVRRTLGRDADDEARGRVEQAAALGIDLRTITGELQSEGVRLFSDSFEGLRDTIERKRAELPAGEERRLSA